MCGSPRPKVNFEKFMNYSWRTLLSYSQPHTNLRHYVQPSATRSAKSGCRPLEKLDTISSEEFTEHQMSIYLRLSWDDDGEGFESILSGS
jgi:hypothetical protein